MMKNMLIGQSGGPTAAINASLSGAVKEAIACGKIDRIFGMRYGIEGLLKGKIIDLRCDLKTPEDFELLERTPAMALGSCRYKLPSVEEDEAVYQEILKIMKEYQIGYFFYIGGNDSMDTVKKLSDYFESCGETIKVVGIPKTIDNDLDCTDHTPGFGSAAKYIATSMLEIVRDSYVYNTPSVTIVEIMGRNAGWLTASSALARLGNTKAPNLIYLPEVAFDVDKFVEDIRILHDTVDNIIVAVSEGVRLADNTYVADSYQSGVVDVFGHKYLSGVGKYLENVVREQLGCKVRAVELNILQRSASHINSATDIEEACQAGAAAVHCAVDKGETGVVVVLDRVSNHPYRVTYSSIGVERIANLEKMIPVSWITEQGNDITEEMMEYLKPLIIGELIDVTKQGLPIHFVFRDVIAEPVTCNA